MNIRQSRLADAIRTYASEDILNLSQLRDHEFGIISVIRVEVSPDYSYADIYVMCQRNQKLLPKFLAPTEQATRKRLAKDFLCELSQISDTGSIQNRKIAQIYFHLFSRSTRNMVFLTKIRNSLKKQKNKSFRESVKEEKNQKYLIQNRAESTKRGKWSFFRKDGNRLSPFSRYIQDRVHITQDFSKRQQFYLRSIGIFLILASIYIIIYSPYFLLSPSKVLIEALDDGIDISIAYRSIEDVYGKNIFTLDEALIIEPIKSYQKNISTVRVDILYPNNIKILLSAHPVIFSTNISNIDGKNWSMTDNGILIPVGESSLRGEKLDQLIIVDSSITEDDLLDYKEIISNERALIIQKMIENFKITWPTLSIEKMYFLKKENEIHIILKNKTRIIFTLQDFTRKTGEDLTYKQLTLQFLTLQTFIENHAAEMSSGAFIYLDVRIPGRIFPVKIR